MIYLFCRILDVFCRIVYLVILELPIHSSFPKQTLFSHVLSLHMSLGIDQLLPLFTLHCKGKITTDAMKTSKVQSRAQSQQALKPVIIPPLHISGKALSFSGAQGSVEPSLEKKSTAKSYHHELCRVYHDRSCTGRCVLEWSTIARISDQLQARLSTYRCF